MVATILVVEDDPAIADLMLTVLVGEGHRVILAHDGVAGLEAVKRGGFDLLVTDYMLPNFNGTVLIAYMHDYPACATPVILMSAALPSVPSLPAPPITTFVPKPFDLDRFLDLVDTLVAAS